MRRKFTSRDPFSGIMLSDGRLVNSAAGTSRFSKILQDVILPIGRVPTLLEGEDSLALHFRPVFYVVAVCKHLTRIPLSMNRLLMLMSARFDLKGPKARKQAISPGQTKGYECRLWSISKKANKGPALQGLSE